MSNVLQPPSSYRHEFVEGIFELNMPSPFCISPDTEGVINYLLQSIQRQMAKGVEEYRRREAEVTNQPTE